MIWDKADRQGGADPEGLGGERKEFGLDSKIKEKLLKGFKQESNTVWLYDLVFFF